MGAGQFGVVSNRPPGATERISSGRVARDPAGDQPPFLTVRVRRL